MAVLSLCVYFVLLTLDSLEQDRVNSSVGEQSKHTRIEPL